MAAVVFRVADVEVVPYHDALPSCGAHEKVDRSSYQDTGLTPRSSSTPCHLCALRVGLVDMTFTRGKIAPPTITKNKKMTARRRFISPSCARADGNRSEAGRRAEKAEDPTSYPRGRKGAEGRLWGRRGSEGGSGWCAPRAYTPGRSCAAPCCGTSPYNWRGGGARSRMPPPQAPVPERRRRPGPAPAGAPWPLPS